MMILFDHRVSSRLFRIGWTPAQLRQFGMIEFSNICAALKRRGYTVETATRLWDEVLSGDEGAKDEMRVMAGVDGILALGPRKAVEAPITSDDDEDSAADTQTEETDGTFAQSNAALAVSVAREAFIGVRDELLARLGNSASPAAVGLLGAITGAAVARWLSEQAIEFDRALFGRGLEAMWLMHGTSGFAGSTAPAVMNQAASFFHEARGRVEAAMAELGTSDATLPVLTAIRKRLEWMGEPFDASPVGPVLLLTCLSLLAVIPQSCSETFD